MTPTELGDMLVTMLTGAAGGTAAKWRRALGEVRCLPLAMAPRSNWRVEPRGSVPELRAIDEAVKVAREHYPYVDQG